MVKVIGVDFSGAEKNNATWIAKGQLEGCNLTISRCYRPSRKQPISHAQLVTELKGLEPHSVVALDFPFSVPVKFARRWQPSADCMPQLWKAASLADLNQFKELRDKFVECHGEPKREADPPESFSCLHNTNPNMVPMTFYGMQMLAGLWESGFNVPPMPEQNSDAPILLEVMPGAVLRSFNLPFKGYKGGQKWLELRKDILNKLPSKSPIRLNIPDAIKLQCLSSKRNGDDCLDAVVAALAAALWSKNQDMFYKPKPQYDRNLSPIVAIEGWLYTPASSV